MDEARFCSLVIGRGAQRGNGARIPIVPRVATRTLARPRFCANGSSTVDSRASTVEDKTRFYLCSVRAMPVSEASRYDTMWYTVMQRLAQNNLFGIEKVCEILHLLTQAYYIQTDELHDFSTQSPTRGNRLYHRLSP